VSRMEDAAPTIVPHIAAVASQEGVAAAMEDAGVASTPPTRKEDRSPGSVGAARSVSRRGTAPSTAGTASTSTMSLMRGVPTLLFTTMVWTAIGTLIQWQQITSPTSSTS
jgi:hypothetical protein